MVKSMTGFAKAEGRIKGGVLSVEIRSFNHRFFEATTRLPPELLIYEEKIKRRLKEKINRGSLNLLFLYTPQRENIKSVSLDRKLIKRYFKMAKEVSQKLGIKNDLNLSNFLNLPGVLNYEEKNIDLSKEWGKCREVLDRAIEKLLKARYREGKVLFKDILKNISSMENSLGNIERRRKEIVDEFREKIRQKFKEITKGELSQEKLLEEISLFLRNTDISEEVVRIKSHLKDMRNLLEKEREVGRKLDFISQEIFREVNTLSAKANDYSISREAVSLKSLIERIREQGQNLE